MKIILIAVDTLRSDHLGCYGYPYETSPGIDQLSEEGVLFEKHYSTDVPTPPAYTAILSGQRGLHTGIFGFGHTNSSSAFGGTYIPATITTPSLVGDLAKAGYRTGMISNLLYPSPWLVQGFKDIAPPGLRFQAGTADEVTEEATGWLNKNYKKDFFLFVHYWDPHVNYFKRAPKKYQDMFFKKDYKKIAPLVEYLEKNRMVNEVYKAHSPGAYSNRYKPEEIVPAYDACIRYCNDGIEKLLNHLEKLKIKDDVFLIFTSDHGEAFGERGFFDHTSCYENIAHVPLIIRWPKHIPPGKRIKSYSLCTDLMPTILDFAQLPIPEGICGRNLKDTLLKGKDTPHQEVVTNTAGVLIQRMFIKDDWALVHTLDKSIYEYLNTYELFDLSKDKAQEKDLAKKEKDKFNEMRSALDRWLDKELKGQPDLLQGIVFKGGGWWFSGIENAFYKNPSLFFKNKRVKELIISRLGEAAEKYFERRERK